MKEKFKTLAKQKGHQLGKYALKNHIVAIFVIIGINIISYSITNNSIGLRDNLIFIFAIPLLAVMIMIFRVPYQIVHKFITIESGILKIIVNILLYIPATSLLIFVLKFMPKTNNDLLDIIIILLFDVIILGGAIILCRMKPEENTNDLVDEV